MEITVSNVATNVALKPGDYNDLLMHGPAPGRAPGTEAPGYITADAETQRQGRGGRRFPDRAGGAAGGQASATSRRPRTKPGAAQLVEFLRVKKHELGYEPYVYLFEEEARQIYQMHGLDLPSNWGKTR
jgi:hypothetical protein